MSTSDENSVKDISTGGGAHIGGTVKTVGDFVGRDKIVYQVHDISGLHSSDKQPLITPRLPPHYIERQEELHELREVVLSRHSVNLTAVYGMGGAGKSVLVCALCQEKEIQNTFIDGVVWVKVGRQPGNLVDQMKKIGVALGDSPHYYTGPESSAGRLSRILGTKAVLIVLDDVWRAQDISCFMFDTPNSHFVITTRNLTVIRALGANCIRLNVLEPSEAVQLLTQISKYDVPELADIAQHLGYLPLAIRLAGTRLSTGMSVETWLNRYRVRISELKLDLNSTDPHENIEACFDLSMEQLPKEEHLLYYSLGVFPEGMWIPQQVICKFWKRLAPKRETHEFVELINALSQLSLIEQDDKRVILHDLLHDYNRNKLGEALPQYHDKLLLAYNPANIPWYQVAHDGYLYHFLPYHLTNASRKTEMFQLLTSCVKWMEQTLDEPCLFLESLIVDIWHIYWEECRDKAKHFLLDEWLSRRISRSCREGYTPRMIAVRCAYEVDFNEGIVAALCHSDERIRSIALTYMYYLSKQVSDTHAFMGERHRVSLKREEPHRSLKILSMVSQKSTDPLFLLHLSALESTFRLLPLLLIDCYRYNELDSPMVSEILSVLNSTLQQISNKLLFRVFHAAIHRRVTRSFLQLLLDVATNAGERTEAREEATSVNNVSEFKRFYELDEDARRLVREALIYVNRTYGSYDDISEKVVQLYQLKERISEIVADYILDAHGIHDPLKAEQVLWRVVNEVNDTSNMTYLFATARWYTIVERQKVVLSRHLSTMREFVTRWLDADSNRFGVVQRYGRKYQYHPLNFYGALWSRGHLGVEENLYQVYMERATETGDRNLLLHIIDSFGDLRHPLYDYYPALRVLRPYIHDPDDEVRVHLVRSLGSLRGLCPSLVEHFLLESEISRDMMSEIRSYSYLKPTSDLYMRFSQLLSDLVAYAPTDFIDKITQVVDKALASQSFDQTATTLITQLLNLALNESYLQM